ncbi:MAG: DUF4236 domain-containing protein [Trueperaceae bacterium]
MRFRKRVKIARGVTLNVGKTSVGVRVGGRGYGVSTNTKTGTRATVGLPGTGLSYSKKVSSAPKGTDPDPEAQVMAIGCLITLGVIIFLAIIIFFLL